MSAPLFSVVMAARDAAPTLRRSLEPFLAGRLGEIEILVVDDGSTDGTRGALEALPDSDRVRAIHLRESIGQTAALNIGIREARGSFIVRQDADDWSHPDRLEAQYREFLRHPRLDILGTGHYVALADGTRLAIPGRNFRDLPKRLSEGPVFCHGSLMMRREALLGIGGYDPFFRYAQDTDLILRAAHKGLKLRNLEACLYEWTDSPSGITATRYAEQAAYEELAASRLENPGLSLPEAFAEILERQSRYPYSLRFRTLQLCLAAGETARARRELVAMREAGEPMPRERRYRLLTSLPGPAYRVLRRLRDGN